MILIIILIVVLIFIFVKSKFISEISMNNPFDNLIKKAKSIGSKYLTHLKKNKFMNIETPAVMFDIDDTLIYTSTHKPIKPMVSLLKECKKAGLKIIIITARLDKYTPETMEELKAFKINYDRLYLRNSKDNVNIFKEKIKEKLAVDENIQTVLSVGDNFIDVKGNFSGFWMKLPNNNDGRLLYPGSGE